MYILFISVTIVTFIYMLKNKELVGCQKGAIIAEDRQENT